MRFRIAATVVDVLPNGNLVLEARKSIRSNQDLWEYSLTGEVRSIDVSSNNTVLSDHIANFKTLLLSCVFHLLVATGIWTLAASSGSSLSADFGQKRSGSKGSVRLRS